MIAAALPARAGFKEWRAVARALLSARAAPDEVMWTDQAAPDLFGDTAPSGSSAAIPVSRTFIALGEQAALHRAPGRWALLYRVLWRLQHRRDLMEDAADPDVVKLRALGKAVARDIHKMHAFVRFREIAGEDGPRYVAWHEPQHHITHAAADFFVDRFTGMRWSIITPEASLHWDGAALTYGPGGVRGDVPTKDARDDDWRIYYESMFNPARLKVAAMKREMPRHFWRNMPETERIPDLIRSASRRTETMVQTEATTPRKRAGAAHARIMPEGLPARLEPVAVHRAPPTSLADLQRALRGCRACPLWCDATQAVPGEGAAEAPLLALVGEQPGDQQDLAGRPFVGPAGQVLDRALAAAGIARAEVFVTNAVKHFKYEPRGKRRLHKRADKGEIEICRWWVKHELDLVKPKLVVALGVTALQSLSSHSGSLAAVRDATLATREGRPLRATIHPSAVLRMPDAAAREEAFDHFVADLTRAHALAAACTSGADLPVDGQCSSA